MDVTLADRLSAVAHHLLDHEGPDALTVRRLAAAAEIAPMSIYNHFGSKEAVVDRVVMEGFADLRDALEALEPTGDPVADLRAGCRVYRQLALRRPHLYAVMFERAIPGYEPSEACRTVGAQSFDVLVRQVDAGQRAGLLAEGSATGLASQLWAALHGLVTLELHGFAVIGDQDAHYDATVDTMLRGMRPD